MKKKTLLISLTIFLALFLPATGCFNAKSSYSQKRFYTLRILRSEGLSASRSDAVLTIRRFRVSPRYEGKGFVHRIGDLRYDTDFYNEFLIAPEVMIAEEVQKWLAGSGLFQYVTGSSSRIEPTFILEGIVTVLYGDYRDKKAPGAVLEMQFFLVRNDAAQPKIVFGKTYHAETPINKISPEALAEGWNRSLEHILTQFEADLTTYTLQRGEAS